MKLSLSAIEMDTSIQCRANIDVATINDYAERMQEGDVFPPIDVYGTTEKCWIGDGWHRVMASQSFGFLDIAATIHSGGRAEALRHALGSNAQHGRRRSNADKRRAVEIAVREWPSKTDAEISELCGVSRPTVAAYRPTDVQTLHMDPEVRTRRDGTPYTVPRPPKEGELPIATDSPRGLPTLGPPCDGMQFARLALMDLDQIRDDDLERVQAFQVVRRWLDERA